MRPTNGDIKVAPTSAHATAWHILNNNVILQWMPSFSRISAALIPSQVLAIFIKTFFVGLTPRSLYIFTKERALATVASVSNERRASTSVLTTPGTIFEISTPKFTASRSIARLTMASKDEPFPSDLAYSTASDTRCLYAGSLLALRMSEGFVVASTGLYFLMASISPVSATILVNLLRASNWFPFGKCVIYSI